MGKVKKSKTEKIEILIETALHFDWCIVDTENKFIFNGNKFKIEEDIEQYKVLNKGVHNIASMDAILCVDDGQEIKFFDQTFKEIGFESVNLV